MKKITKTFTIIFIVLLVLFLGFVTYYYLGSSDQTKIIRLVKEKSGIDQINSIDDIELKIIPLSNMLINKYYPPIYSEAGIQFHVLDKEDFNKTVSDRVKSPEMSIDESRAVVVSIDNMEGTTFCPGSDVYIKYLGDSLPVAGYLHHVVHELFHGMSCSTRTLPSVWEEFLTDYFTSNVISNYLGENPDSIMVFGYGIKVIRSLSDFVTEDELINIYLNKDESSLKAIIENRFGKGSYESLYNDLEDIFRGTDYDEGGFQNNRSIDESLQRVEELLSFERE